MFDCLKLTKRKLKIILIKILKLTITGFNIFALTCINPANESPFYTAVIYVLIITAPVVNKIE